MRRRRGVESWANSDDNKVLFVNMIRRWLDFTGFVANVNAQRPTIQGHYDFIQKVKADSIDYDVEMLSKMVKAHVKMFENKTVDAVHEQLRNRLDDLYLG